MELVSATLAAMPETRRTMLNALKKRGELLAEELAEVSGITASGTRQHLQALEADGLVTHLEQREGRGRPKHVFKLTPAADALYPRTYSELTNELLEYVQDDDPELLERIFKRRMQRRLERTQLRLKPLKSLEARLQELTKILDEDGYLADLEVVNPELGGRGKFRITEHNCAIHAIALRYGQACSTELEFLRLALPGTKVERVAHMIAGSHVCAYEVTPKTRVVRK
jgi:DeoR family transcriptional regulator, suf operon transcriptional repressor